MRVCCSALQCVAVCCSVLQCFAVCCSVLQCVAVRCSTPCVAVRCSRRVLQYLTFACNTRGMRALGFHIRRMCVAECMLQCVLQHIPRVWMCGNTHCNMRSATYMETRIPRALGFRASAGVRGGGLGSRPKKMYGERLGDGVEYHLMKPTPRR